MHFVNEGWKRNSGGQNACWQRRYGSSKVTGFLRDKCCTCRGLLLGDNYKVLSLSRQSSPRNLFAPVQSFVSTWQVLHSRPNRRMLIERPNLRNFQHSSGLSFISFLGSTVAILRNHQQSTVEPFERISVVDQNLVNQRNFLSHRR